MTKWFTVFVLLVGCSTGSLRSSAKFSLDGVDEEKLKNGLTVLMLKDTSLPYFSVSMMVNMGAIDDPSHRKGLSSLVAELLDKGTQKKSATEIADAFGQIGSSFGASVSDDYTILGAETMSRHAGDLLKLVGEIVTEQSFADAEIARAKSRTLSFIAKSSDDPSSFTDRAHNAFLYSSHPYGAPVAGTKSSVQAIQRKDIIRQYKKFFRPNNSVIAVVGNFDGNVLKEVESAFGKWESFPVESESLPKLEEAKGISLRVVDNPALAQSQIRIGHLGIKRSDEDFLSIRVANTVLGSGFTSRLMDTIRDNMGLTYSISSSFDSRLDRGPFEISTFTRNDMVGKTVKETLKIYKEFWEKGISEKELESTKAYLLGVFPQAIETKEKLAFNLLILRRYGISYDYLKDYGKNVSKMTLSEVNESIRKHFHPDNLKVTIYGPASKVVSQVRSVGVVETRNFKEFQ